MLYQSGFPLTLSAGNNTAGGGTRPNFMGQDPQFPDDRPRGEQILQWFNTNAFAAPPAFTFSDVRTPAFRNVDFSVIKNTRLSEGTNLQFRSEFFNFANFGPPNAKRNSPQFGQIVASRSGALPQVMQFGLKLTLGGGEVR